jgi:hypothetical protein
MVIFINVNTNNDVIFFFNNSKRRVISMSGIYVVTDVSKEFAASILWMCVITRQGHWC